MTAPASLATLHVQRYVTPLREGGSVPALVEGDDGAMYVLKFRGAAQGPSALCAEVIVGELARSFGLRMPALVRLLLDPALARNEPDAEIRDLLRASADVDPERGSNLGVAHLPAALPFDPAAAKKAGYPVALDGPLASQIVVLDAFAMNVDRTARNPNLLLSGGQLWLIDHGAALYFQHDWDGGKEGSQRGFSRVRDHVLLPWADALEDAGAAWAAHLSRARIAAAVDLVPGEWLNLPAQLPSVADRRAAFVDYLVERAAVLPALVNEAMDARARLV